MFRVSRKIPNNGSSRTLFGRPVGTSRRRCASERSSRRDRSSTIVLHSSLPSLAGLSPCLFVASAWGPLLLRRVFLPTIESRQRVDLTARGTRSGIGSRKNHARTGPRQSAQELPSPDEGRSMAPDLVSPTPVNAARTVHFRLDGDASAATSPAASEPSTRSSTAFSIPPPPASPLPPVLTPDKPGSSSRGTYFHDEDYYEDTDEHQPVASTSKLVHGRAEPTDEDLRHYPPRPLASSVSSREAQFDLDSEEIDTHDTSAQPLMEGLVHSGLRRASLDLRGEARRLKELELDAEEAEPPDWLSRGGGIWAGIANMSNSILGAGIIGLPYALREAGFFSGIALLVILGVVTDWTIRLIVLNAKMSGRRTYIDILDSCFGKPGRAAASFFQFAFAFGGMCAFCVIIGDTLPRVFQWLVGPDPNAVTSFFISRRIVTTILTVGVSYPLSLYRDIEKLSHASALALVSMVVIVISVGVRGPTVEDALKGDSSERWTFLESVRGPSVPPRWPHPSITENQPLTLRVCSSRSASSPSPLSAITTAS